MFGMRAIYVWALVAALATFAACERPPEEPPSSALTWDSGAWDQANWQ